METLGDDLVTKNSQKNAKNFYCDICDFKCSKISNWNNHLLTAKHVKVTLSSQKVTQKMPKMPHDKYMCDSCQKTYCSRNGLWKHKKNCPIEDKITPQSSQINNIDKDDLIIMLLKQNAELIKCQQDITMKVLENGPCSAQMNNSHNTTTHTNSHNKAFNLNLFLNETCKNAMNINDFVDSIKLQLSDFMEVGEAGYVQGISNIIVKKLKDLDETIRPIHCTDQKRETFYVKDENKWEKEEEDFKNIRKMIKKVALKNERLMTSYKEKYPDYNDPESKNSDIYSKFVIEALGGEGDNNFEKENKIIKHISKATTIKNKNK
jgi:hypothetical protein